MSKSRTSVCDSSVTRLDADARNAASSLFGGRNTRSHTIPSSALNSEYTVWNPRLDIPTKYVFGKARATRSRPPCGLVMKPTSFVRRSRARSRCDQDFCGMERRETEPELERSLARELRLVRRRSRLPWVYSVYHRPPPAPGRPYDCRRKKAGTSSGVLASNTFSPAETPRWEVARFDSDSSTTGRRLTPTVGGAPG